MSPFPDPVSTGDAAGSRTGLPEEAPLREAGSRKGSPFPGMDEIAVVGAGIGGLTLALALERQGVSATVYEAAPDLREVGAGIWIPPNAMQVLDGVGASEAVTAEGMPVRRMEVRTHRGRLLRSLDLTTVGRRLGTTTVSIHRGRLQRILHDLLPRGRVRLGHRCVEIVDVARAPELRFEGGSRTRARLVVGADGIRSVVREVVDPDVSARSTGQVAVRGIAPCALPESLGGVSGEFWGPGHRFGFAAIGPRETYWWCAYDVDRHGAEFSGHPLDGARALGHRYPEPIPGMLESTSPEGVISTPLEDLPSLRAWHRGRVVLLGDAAHAMTPNLGQGGAQAMEDARTLAEILGSVGPVQPHLLHAYQEARRARAEWVATLSRRVGALAQITNPLARRARDALLSHLPRRMEDRQVRTLYALR